MRYFAMTRVSTAKQVDNLSPGIQLEAIRRFGDANGWTQVDPTYFDQVSRDSFEEREGLQKALQRIRNGEAEALIFYDLSRVGVENSINEIIEAVYSAGGKIGLALEGKLYETRTDIIEATLFLKAAYTHEFMQIRKRTFAGVRRAIQLGAWLGKPVYGYKIVNTLTESGERVKKLAIDPEKAEIVIEVFERLIAGEGRAQITKNIEQAYRTKLPYYQMSKIQERVALYAGGTESYTRKVQDEMIPYTYTFPQIISDDLYRRFIAAEPFISRGYFKADAQVTPLKGLVFCSHCGRDMQNGGRRHNSVSLCCASLKNKYHKDYWKNEETPEYCPYQISHNKVAKQVKAYLQGLNTSSYQDDVVAWRDSLEMIEAYITSYEVDLAEISEKRDGITERISTVAAEGLLEVAAVLNKQLVELRQSEEEIQRKVQAAQNFGSLVNRALDNLVTDEDELQKLISKTVEAMDAQDWKSANSLLAQLGVVIDVNFNVKPVTIDRIEINLPRLWKTDKDDSGNSGFIPGSKKLRATRSSSVETKDSNLFKLLPYQLRIR